jgi:rRNA maturation RNase YbeY
VDKTTSQKKEEEMKGLDFETDGMPFPSVKKAKAKKWAADVAISLGKKVVDVCCIFGSDEFVRQVNVQYLQHDYYTDIVTLDYSVGDDLYGDLYISLDRVRENAEALGVAYEQELHRVIIHGILHLCGLGDKTKAQQRQMREAEEKALALLDS